MKYTFTKLKTALVGLMVWSIALCLPITTLADEGMWLPHLLKILNEKEMQEAGLKLTAEDIYSINRASLKDGVLQFGNGCTGEVIGSNALVLTNHHCGFGAIQFHSTLQNNYLRDGFWAKNQDEELYMPGLTASFVIRIDDVTASIMEGIGPNTPEKERQALIALRIKKIKTEKEAGTHYQAVIKPFYYGTEYLCFMMEVFNDVRLVGAPPSGIGKYGGDTDNWEWPRHTGDFSLFRVYANRETNKPAAYSKYNLPFKPRYHFPISVSGVQPGDFTMVMGFPGRTQEYLSSYGVKMITDVLNKPRIDIRTKQLKIIGDESKKSAKVQLQYADKQAGIANAWKKWQGETGGLKRLNAFEKKQEQELAFMKWVSVGDPKRFNTYANVLEGLKANYLELETFIIAQEFLREAVYSTEALGEVLRYRTLTDSKPDSIVNLWLKNQPEIQAEFYKDYDVNVDLMLFACNMKEYATVVPENLQPTYFKDLVKIYNSDFVAMGKALYAKSWVTDSLKAKTINNPKNFKKLKNIVGTDPLFELAMSFQTKFETEFKARAAGLQEKIELGNRLLLQGMREMQTTKKFYPDANFTLRVTYGKVASYKPRDGVEYQTYTTLDGLVQKYDSTVEEFRAPKKLLELHKNKDYGQFANEKGEMPVAFIARNHTTGGNSGSPVLNGLGHLVGLNFDRSWEGTMSDVMYDPDRCRNIAMDSRYLLFIIDKFAGAGYLLQEMTLVKDKLSPEKQAVTPNTEKK